MNYYPHHIGDFNTATRHLSRLERAIYRDALDMYYDSESPLDGSDFDRLAKRLLCRDAEEIAALQFVLDEFFEQQDGGLWTHHLCDQEIAKFKAAQADAGVVKSNEKQRQVRSRAERSAMFSALKAAGVAVKWNSRMGDLRALCAQHGIALPGVDGVTPSVTAPAVTGSVIASQRHGSGTATQNQNQNHIKPPNPPAGGAGAGLAVATALSSHFPTHRRTRIAEVAELIAAIEAEGLATGEQLLNAAALQAEELGREGGKHAPNVLTWLRRKCWLDCAALQAGGAPADWRQSRSGVEAMGERLGLGRWDESRHRLFAQYEAAVVAALEAQTVTAGA